MFSRNPNRIFRKMRFWTKWKTLKAKGLFNDVEIAKIEKFHEERNTLFHSELFNYPKYYNEREELMKSSKDAFDAVFEAYCRKHNLKW